MDEQNVNVTVFFVLGPCSGLDADDTVPETGESRSSFAGKKGAGNDLVRISRICVGDGTVA